MLNNDYKQYNFVYLNDIYTKIKNTMEKCIIYSLIPYDFTTTYDE